MNRGSDITNKKPIFIILLLTSVFLLSGESSHICLKKLSTSKIPEDLIIPELNSLIVDDKGNVFGFAGKSGGGECFVIKYDSNLNYLRHFGTAGKGPGSFSTYSSAITNRLSIDTNGDVYVIDYNPRRFVVFNNSGKYKEDIFIDRDYLKDIGSIYQIKIVGDGLFCALQYRRDVPPIGILFSMKPSNILRKYPFVEKRIQYRFSDISSEYFGRNCFVETESNIVVLANSQVYKFAVYDKSGKLIMTVADRKRCIGDFSENELKYLKTEFLTPKSGFSQGRNDFLRQLNADKSELKRIVNEVKKSKNVILDIKVSADSIYVFTAPDDITVKARWPVEIYKLSHGNKIYRRGFFKRRPCKFWNGYAFFLDRDADDNPAISKYKID